MRKYEDFTGKVFGRLTVISRVRNGNRHGWLCKCSCGNTTVVMAGNLKCGATTSCGCVAKERSRNQLLKHGESKTRLYRIWNGMMRRCYEVSNKDYKNYGHRGISVCDEWHNYSEFRDWAFSNGYYDDLTIDRIDPNGNYAPNNCRWATPKEQNNNRRSNHVITYLGVSKNISQWSEETGIPPKTILYRINAGWSVHESLTTPVNYNNRLAKHL